MAISSPKLAVQAPHATIGQQSPAMLLQPEHRKSGRHYPLSSLASSVRNATVVVIDAVMGRYDR